LNILRKTSSCANTNILLRSAQSTHHDVLLRSRRPVLRYQAPAPITSTEHVTDVDSGRTLGQCHSHTLRRPVPRKKYAHPPSQSDITHVQAANREAPTPYPRIRDAEQLLTGECLVGWTASAAEPGFGGQRDDASVKARMINLVSSVRTLMRSTFPHTAGIGSWRTRVARKYAHHCEM
jgi:hypothetical protein